MRLFKSAASILFILIAAASLSACVDDDFTTMPPKDPAERAIGGPAISAAGYHISVGDHVRVTVFGTTPITNEYTIDDTGSIAIAPMGPIHVKTTPPPKQRPSSPRATRKPVSIATPASRSSL